MTGPEHPHIGEHADHVPLAIVADHPRGATPHVGDLGRAGEVDAQRVEGLAHFRFRGRSVVVDHPHTVGVTTALRDRFARS